MTLRFKDVTMVWCPSCGYLSYKGKEEKKPNHCPACFDAKSTERVYKKDGTKDDDEWYGGLKECGM